MSQIMGYLSRSTGFVALGLGAWSLVWGTLFSARETGTRRRPNWWLDLHNWLGGLALFFTGVHILTAVLDTDAGVNLAGAVLPGLADNSRWAITWGVIGAYLWAAAVFTTWPKRLSSRRLWRVIHLGSVGGLALALVHTYQVGTDARRSGAEIAMLVIVAATTYVLGLRLIGVVLARRASNDANSQAAHSKG